jgi:cell shape-determining protein MreD
MKKITIAILWTLFWLTLQSTLFVDFPANSARINIVFLSVIAIGFAYEFGEGFFTVFLISFITDAASYPPFGIITLSYCLAFCMIRFATSTIYSNSLIARFVWTTIVSMATVWVEGALLALILKNPVFIFKALLAFVPQALLNGVLGLAVIPAFLWCLNISWEKIFKKKGLVLD